MWPFNREHRAVRAQGNYAGTILNQWESSARVGTDATDPSTLAVVGACARLWSDSLADCEVTGANAVDRRFLAMLGADLIRRGHSRWHIRTNGAGLELRRPAYAQRTSGGWILTWHEDPGDSRTETVLPQEIANLRWEHTADNAWDGIPPWRSVSASFLAEVDAAGRDTASGPAGYLLAVQKRSAEDYDFPSTTTQQHDAAVGMSREILPNLQGKNRGRLSVFVSPGGYTQGSTGVEPAQLGYKAEQGLASLRHELVRELAASCGAPYELIAGGSAASIRESQRIFAGRLQHRCDRLSEDLSEQLGTMVTIDASKVFRSDLTTRARALRQLVDAGMTLEQAREVAGV